MCGTDHGRLAFGRPKTSSGEDRIVDLDPRTVSVLLEHRLRQRQGAGDLGRGLQRPRPRLRPRGRHADPPDRVSDRFAELVAEAGLRPVRLHDLRHGQASLLLAAGIDIVVVSERLGHSSLAISSDTYSHLLERVGREAAERAWALVPRSLPPHVNQDREHSVRIRASERGPQSRTTSRSSARGASPGHSPRPALFRVAPDVTLTTESRGRPLTAAGRNTVPGNVATQVLGVIAEASPAGCACGNHPRRRRPVDAPPAGSWQGRDGPPTSVHPA